MENDRTLIVIPTYNERENIGPIVARVLDVATEADVLVVDDQSTDGTVAEAQHLFGGNPRFSAVTHIGSRSFGRSLLDGYRIAFERGYARLIQMDADFSHDPKCLPQFIEAIAECDLVIGSRYIPGGSTPDWALSRRLISRFGNWLARTTLRLKVRDCTSGYRCYRREALSSLDLDSIKVVGYWFQIETVRQTAAAGMRMCEIPITFIDRRAARHLASAPDAAAKLTGDFRELVGLFSPPGARAEDIQRFSQYLAAILDSLIPAKPPEPKVEPAPVATNIERIA